MKNYKIELTKEQLNRIIYAVRDEKNTLKEYAGNEIKGYFYEEYKEYRDLENMLTDITF